ncbi:AAA ATPase cdc48, partial [Friedmanniomyces endolithicus]
RAVKLAIKESIGLALEKEKAREGAGDDVKMEEDADEEDPVPELTKRHFEEAMSTARRSVTDTEIRRYEAFAQSMKNSGGGSAFFRFPEGGADGGAAEQQQNGAGEEDL